MLVLNVSGVRVEEKFQGYGVMSIEIDEVKDLPEGVVKCWMNEIRCGQVLVKPVEISKDQLEDVVEVEEAEQVEEVPVKTPRKFGKK